MITAIRDKKRQQAVVIFPAPFSIFTSEDIAANGGIEFSELLNSEENLCMGRAVQSNVSVTLINSNKLLSSVDFTQEFTAALGVETASGETAVRSGATLAVKVGSHVITASPSWSQVYFNSAAYSVSGTPAALFVYENTLFVIGNAGTVINAFTISGSTMMAAALPTWNAFMLDKASKWAARGACLSYVGGVMQECSVSAGVMAYKTSQFVPLGHFVGGKPDKVKTQLVTLTGYDLMQKFEVPAAEFLANRPYPLKLRGLFNGLCSYCGVSVGDTTAALNMNKSFSAAPITGDNITCREVLAYIAEAAGCYARMSRDGKCELVWFSDVDYTLNRTDYFSIDEAEYTVQRIDKLQSHVTKDDIGVIVGDGTNGYDIIDNPFLNGATDAEARPWVENIYTRLAAFPEYSPITVNCESYWALRCGDIITVVTEEGNKQLPIFAQTISWAGNARASIQSTGEQTRGIMSATNREKLVNGRNYFELTKSVEGMTLNITSIQDVANEAKNTANAASTAAGNAQATANSAQSAANSAQSAANAASAGVSTLTEKVNKVEASVSPEGIITTVTQSETYKTDLKATKDGAVSDANSNTETKLKDYSTVEQTAKSITAALESVQIGSRNLIRNSEGLLFENYYFTGALVVTHDGAGNVTVVSGASAFAGEDGQVTIKTAASVSHDGAGNVTITG